MAKVKDTGYRMIIENHGGRWMFVNDDIYVNGENIQDKLTSLNISENVSKYAAIKEVRERLVENMRRMSNKYDVVMDGRDIGTVVLRDSNNKFFLTATAEARAERRVKELNNSNIDVSYEEILRGIKERDYLDENREIDPLTKAEEAIEIDSTNLKIEEVVGYIIDNIRN